MSWYYILQLLGQFLMLLLLVLLVLLSMLALYGQKKSKELTTKLEWSSVHNKDLGDALVRIYIRLVFERIISSTIYTNDEVRLLIDAIKRNIGESDARIHFGDHARICRIFIDSRHIRDVGQVAGTNLVISLMKESQVFTDEEIEEEGHKLFALAYHSPIS